MDVCRVLAAPDLQVREKTLDLVLDLLSSQNVSEVVLLLQKEVSKTHR
jgi:coatomer subunit beta